MKAIILAAGRSKRMGRDKASIARPDGTLQLDYLIELVKSVGLEVVVSTQSRSKVPPGLPILSDLRPGSGPLAALEAFHHSFPGEPVLLLGCDLFLLDEATLSQLLDQHDPTQQASAFLNRIDHRPEPLCAIYPCGAIVKACDALDKQQFCARHFLEELDPQLLALQNPVALDNANTAEEMDECSAKLTRGVEKKSIRVRYYAKLREARGLEEETVESLACTAGGIFHELHFRHRFPLELDALRCARNDEFCKWNALIETGDEIIFLPPFAGG